MTIRITLTDEQVANVKAVALEVHNRRKHAGLGAMNRQYDEPLRLQLITRAFMAEFATALYLNRNWNCEYGGPKGCDVEPNIEVRSCEHGRRLYIKDREIKPGPYQKPPKTNYVLAWFCDHLRDVDLVGFNALDAAIATSTPHQEHGKTFGWMVPAEKLRPIEELYAALN